jgi:flagellar basal body rod protein FlgB
MIKFIHAVMMILFLSIPLYAQSFDSKNIESIFLSPKYTDLQEGIREASKRQALYAYNIANLAVPNFQPILPKEDQLMFNELAVSNGYSREVLLEFLMSRMTDNSKKYNAYLAMWKSKVDGLKRIVSLGK